MKVLLTLIFLVFSSPWAFAQKVDVYKLKEDRKIQRNKCREVLALRKSKTIKKGSREYKELVSDNIPYCYALAAKTFAKEDPKLMTRLCSEFQYKKACYHLRGGAVSEDRSDILKWGSIIAIAIAVYLISMTMFQDEEQFKAQEKLDDSEKSTNIYAQHGFVLRYSRPFFKRYFSPIVSSMKNKKQIKEKYKRKLATAGLTDILTPEDLYAFKLFLIIGFPITFLGIRWFLEESWPLALIPVLGIVGFFYPDIWIDGKGKQRQEAITLNMPFSVDMLALSVEAGLDFIAAMTKVIEKAKSNPLTDEFEILLKEIKIGASRSEALRNMAWRVDMVQMSSFCATLIAADSVGASVGPILKALGGEIRQKRSALAEKAGATAATKILFPMMFLIVPAVMIMVFAPLGLQMMLGGN